MTGDWLRWLTLLGDSVRMRRVKFALPFVLGLALATAGCNTIENRRSLYSPKEADGPYTRALKEGTWNQPKTVDQQYEESKRQRATRKSGPAPAPEEAPQAGAL